MSQQPYREIATGNVVSQLHGIAMRSRDSVEASLESSRGREQRGMGKAIQRRNGIAAQLQLDKVLPNIALAASMNEGANANSHITKLVRAEQLRLKGNMRDVKREQHRLSSDLLQSGYDRKYYANAIRLVWITMLVTLVMFAIGAAWRMVWIGSTTAIVLASLVVIVYLGACVYTMSRMKLYRAKYLGDPIWEVTNENMRSAVGLPT
jgi:hypothetical protein